MKARPGQRASGRTGASARLRVRSLLRALHRARPDPRVELEHDSPFQLLIATILSARCTDARVNQVTPVLFRVYPDAEALARAPLADLERAVRPAGFFRAKARAIKGCCQEMVSRHGGEVPRTMEELTALPGIGRKTANVLLGAGFGIAAGVVVDTHMARVARRLGLTRRSDPVRIEADLMRLLPPAEWIFASIALVLHGRYVCLARRPHCAACPLRRDCPSRDPQVAGRPRRHPAPDRA